MILIHNSQWAVTIVQKLSMIPKKTTKTMTAIVV